MTSALRPDARTLLDYLAALSAPTGGVAGEREMARKMVADCDISRDPKVSAEDMQIPGGSGDPLTIRIYHHHRQDEDGTAAPAILFFHGGGWKVCDIGTHDGLCAEISRRLGITAVSVDYRLAPEHKFPAALDDAIAACRWLAASPGQISHPVSGIILAGDSAGGNLAAGCTAIRQSLPIPIAAQLLMYATLDFGASGGSQDEYAEGYLLSIAAMNASRQSLFTDAAQMLDPRASPLRDPDFASLPPSMVFACECDPLRDQSRSYAARLAQHGVAVRYREAKGQLHGCFTMRRIMPSAQHDLEACLTDLESLLAEAGWTIGECG